MCPLITFFLVRANLILYKNQHWNYQSWQGIFLKKKKTKYLYGKNIGYIDLERPKNTVILF